MNTESSDDPSEEISQVYSLLKKDAKLLIGDLNEGVSLWRSFSNILVLVSFLGFWLAYIAVFPSVLVHGYTIVALLSALAIGVTCAVGSLLGRRKYNRLRTKYEELFQAAKRLG
jgi:hypothetical protein